MSYFDLSCFDLTFAQRAFCAAAIFRRAAADRVRRDTVANFPPSNLPSTARAASTWRRLFTRCALSALNSATIFPNPFNLGIVELYRIVQGASGQAVLKWHGNAEAKTRLFSNFKIARAIRGIFVWHIRAIPIPLLRGYLGGGQFLGGGTCSSDSSHDCKVWDVLFCGLNVLGRSDPLE